MKWFKSKTLNNVVIMGKNTYKSIGKPLKDRINIIISKTLRNGISNLETGINLAEQYTDKDIFIIGGASIYKYALECDLVDEVLINMLNINVPNADAFFPELDLNKWIVKQINYCPEMDSKIVKYIRRNGNNR